MSRFDSQHLLEQLAEINPTPGIWRDIPTPVGSYYGAASTANANGMAYRVFDGSSDVLRVEFMVPLDYDQASDDIKIIVLARAVTTLTNTLEIDTVNYWRPDASAVASPTAPAGVASQIISSANLVKYTFDLSGIGLRPGDAVSAELGGTISADEVRVYAATPRYRSSIVAYNQSDRI